MSTICKAAFHHARIDINGDIFPCCPFFTDYYSFGNMFKSSFDEVWNSEKAKMFRKRILQGDYSLCHDRKLCKSEAYLFGENDGTCQITMPAGPSKVWFAYDRQCNLACVTCRTRVLENSEKMCNELDSKLDSFLLPADSTCKCNTLKVE